MGGIDDILASGREGMALMRMPPTLTHEERMERWKERNQEAEFYVWCGVGLIVALMLFGAFRR